MKVTDFDYPQEHPWGMLEGVKDANENERLLAFMLTKCIEAGAFVPVKTKLSHRGMVTAGLLEEVGDRTYTLTKKAIGLLWGYYGKEEPERPDLVAQLLEALELLVEMADDPIRFAACRSTRLDKARAAIEAARED